MSMLLMILSPSCWKRKISPATLHAWPYLPMKSDWLPLIFRMIAYAKGATVNLVSTTFDMSSCTA